MMGSDLRAQKIIRDRVTSYGDMVDLWKADHEEAMRYFDFCELIHNGIELFKETCRFDEAWRLSVLRKETPFDQGFADNVRWFFERLRPPFSVIKNVLIPEFTAKFGDVPRLDEFLQCARELEGLLTPDEKFFDSEKLAGLRDEALEENQRGACEPWPA